MNTDRHSVAENKELISDPLEKARREVENGLLQYELVLETVREHVAPISTPFRLRPALVLRLQEAALRGIDAHAGSYRNAQMRISGSSHQPPEYFEVAEEVALLCEYVNEGWKNVSAIHLGAYILWKLNWIHPFLDGNGRTARALSYLVMSVKLDTLLPGTPSIPEQIAADKGPYYDALELADNAHADNRLDVSGLEQMLETMLLKQLLSHPSLPPSVHNGVQATIDLRISRAPSSILEQCYGTGNPATELWAVGDYLILQVGAQKAISEAQERNSSHGSPFPHLLAVGGAVAQRRVDSPLSRIANHEAHVGPEYAISLVRGSSLTLSAAYITYEEHGEPATWALSSTLYIVRIGSSLTLESVSNAVDLLIAKDLSRFKRL